jgi:hypothetical protein
MRAMGLMSQANWMRWKRWGLPEPEAEWGLADLRAEPTFQAAIVEKWWAPSAALVPNDW